MPKIPAAPAAPGRPATPAAPAQPSPSFEDLAEGDSHSDEAPSVVGIGLDAIAAAFAIAFVVLLAIDVVPFL
ncbi:MAG: hypothetical protein ACON4O_04545 [Lentimonas sp.]